MRPSKTGYTITEHMSIVTGFDQAIKAIRAQIVDRICYMLEATGGEYRALRTVITRADAIRATRDPDTGKPEDYDLSIGDIGWIRVKPDGTCEVGAGRCYAPARTLPVSIGSPLWHALADRNEPDRR